MLCNNCIKDLENATNFKVLCIESDILRQKYIKEHPVDTKNNKANNAASSSSTTSFDDKPMFDDDDSSSDFFDASNDSFSAKEDDDKRKPKQDAEKKDKLTEPLTCSDCSKTFKSLASLKLHCRRVHKSESKTVSTVKKRKAKSTAEKVKREVVKPVLPSYIDRTKRMCTLCDRTFSTTSTLFNHIRNKHTFEKKYKCDLCTMSFTNSAQLRRHKTKHTGERNHICYLCGKKYLTNSDLNHHVQRHDKKLKYKCDICENKSFNTTNSLRLHKQAVHTNPEDWKHLCPQCGRKCLTQTALNIHMKRHLNIRNFQCHICQKKFVTRNEMTKHIRSHSNVRLHECSMCGLDYKDKTSLSRHLMKKHGIGGPKTSKRDEKLSCDDCSKVFPNGQQLEKHKRTHIGEKQFKCNLCDQSFACESYIKGHMFVKHGITTEGIGSNVAVENIVR